METSFIYNKGITRAGGEATCSNGELAMGVNLQPTGDALRGATMELTPVLNGATMTWEGVVFELKYIHQTSRYRHYIGVKESIVRWWAEPKESDVADDGSVTIRTGQVADRPGHGIVSLEAVGNTLVMLWDDHVEHSLWDLEKGEYRDLGEKPPFCNLQFQLVNAFDEAYRDDNEKVPAGQEDIYDEVHFFDRAIYETSIESFGNRTVIGERSIQDALSYKSYCEKYMPASDQLGDVTTYVMAALNQAISAARSRGMIYAPVLLRYCITMYDGTTTMHSAPVYMPTLTDRPQEVYMPGMKWGRRRDNLIQINNGNHRFRLMPHFACCKIAWRSLDENYRLLFTDWKDIVKSVDIYVTPAINRINQDKLVKSFSRHFFESTSYVKGSERELPDNNYTVRDGIARSQYDMLKILNGQVRENKNRGLNIYNFADDDTSDNGLLSMAAVDFDELSNAEWEEKIAKQNTFFRLLSIKKEEDFGKTAAEAKTWKRLKYESSTWATITAQKQLKDEYKSHHSLGANGCYVYNHRLNLYNIKEYLFEGFIPSVMLPYCKGTAFGAGYNNGNYKNCTTSTMKTASEVTVVTTLKTDDGTKTVAVKEKNFTVWPKLLINSYIYYPDARATQISIGDLTLKLEESEVLNGAVRPANLDRTYEGKKPEEYNLTGKSQVTRISRVEDEDYDPNDGVTIGDAGEEEKIDDGEIGWTDKTDTTHEWIDPDDSFPVSDNPWVGGGSGTIPDDAGSSTPELGAVVIDNEVRWPNKIYVSAIDNPFVFPVEGMVSVGTGELIGIASQTIALSQGQFGQYPLTAFTTDGVWVLEISSSGTYSSIRPLTRDVCTDGRTITMLDKAIVYAGEKGMQMLAGSESVNISAALDGMRIDIVHEMRQMAGSLTVLAPEIADYLQDGAHSPIEDLKKAKIINDHLNKRLIFIGHEETDTDHTICNVYDQTSQTWWQMTVPHESVSAWYNSYPYTYVQDIRGAVARIDKDVMQSMDRQKVDALIVTRAIKLDGLRKVLTGLTHVTTARNPSPVMWIYGSNDLIDWHLVGHTNKIRRDSMPGRSWIYYKVAIFLQIAPTEVYAGTEVRYIMKSNK